MVQQSDDVLGIYSGPLLANFEGYKDNGFAFGLDEERTLFLGGFKAVFLEVTALNLNWRGEQERSDQRYGLVITPHQNYRATISLAA